MSKVIVIGGGAAGMMAAITAAERGAQVTLIEKNEKLGKKLFITGKGRCNVTNAADMDVLFANICTNKKFLYSAFYSFDNLAVMDFIEKAGCPLKTERGDRVFPVSDHSSDVIAAFTRELKKRNVEILLHTEVKHLLVTKEEDGSDSVNGVVLSDGKKLLAERVIVCTGGLSYPTTGSTGDGYRFAKETGHGVVDQRPGLVPVNVAESWCTDLMGLSLKNVSLRMETGGECLYEGFGEMMFTHFGLTGPLVLSASSFYGNGKKGKKKVTAESGTENAETVKQGKAKDDETKIIIDLKPAMSMEQLDKRLLRDFEENKNKQFRNSLHALFPGKLIPVMIALSHIPPEKKVNEISREERHAFLHLIKNLTLTVTGLRGFGEAIITRGGISVKDINPSTMESKLVKGLYFAGEVIDLDALTGGFNLQIAWSTGYLAGLG